MRDEDLSRVIGNAIRRRREELGLKLAQLGERLGISESMLSRVENGQRGLDSTMLRAVAQVLEMPMVALFEGHQEATAASRVLVYARNSGGDEKATKPLEVWGRRILADLALTRQLQ